MVSTPGAGPSRPTPPQIQSQPLPQPHSQSHHRSQSQSQTQSQSNATQPTRPPKRLRTRRACDYCREHRIRCEYTNGSEQGSCAHCENFGIPCMKVAEAPPDERPRAAKMQKSGGGSSARDESATMSESPRALIPGTVTDHLYLGPTSFSQQVHHHFSGTPFALDQLRYLEEKLELSYDVFQWAKGTGYLVGSRGNMASSPLPVSPQNRRINQSSAPTFSRINDKIVEEIGGITMWNKFCHGQIVPNNIHVPSVMYQAQTRIIPVWPVASVHESLGSEGPTEEFLQTFITHHPESAPITPPPRATRLALCTLAAMSRDVPSNIRESLLSALNAAVDAHDFATSSLSTVQLLLLLSVNDVLANEIGRPGRAVYNATRMATEIALHRNVSPTFSAVSHLHRRARVWGACIIADRWCSVRQGQMPSLDLSHADAPLPFSYPDHVVEPDLTLTPCFMFHLAMTRLAELLGRAYHLTGTPAGLARAEDLKLLLWQRDFEAWVEGLPAQWPYSFRLETPEAASILSLLAVSVLYTFLQPFFWPTAPIPPNLAYRPPAKMMEDLQSRSTAAINWVSGPGQYYLDIWPMLIHPFLSCLLVQAKGLRSGDPLAAVMLDTGIQSIQSWAECGPNRSLMHLPRDAISKTVEILKTEQVLVFPWIPATISNWMTEMNL
ncbi:hypothetical protein I203_101950 [Kwoniella mangroviensis CBS 8507]|uniref:uncharacterized protein n=1 Tax=Kwoniella mangroviensis CBS 8507 TaxID=1296122 RepID=UPI00080CD3D9|nr:uncharacterized protein I203_03145 [Kwoniella mangroviensis CBS 8507]OCF67450.1 hypothetical protein I203_03145 [Kwoniella mangroviensis CBS 8507]